MLLYGAEVISYVRALLDNPTDRDDAYAEWCLAVVDAMARFRWGSSLRTLAFVLARRAVFRVVLQRNRAARPGLDATGLSEVAEQVRNDTLRLITTTAEAAVARMRADLDEEERSLLVLYVDRQLPWADVARILQESSTAPAVQRSREEARLRKKFERLKRKLRARAEEAGLHDVLDDRRALVEERSHHADGRKDVHRPE